MRIAIFHDLPSGGAKRTLYEKVWRLSNNHQLDVYVFSTADESFCDLRRWINSYRVYPVTAPKLLKSPFGRLNQMSRWLHLQEINKLCRQIAADIDSADYDVVWAEPSQWTQAPLILPYLSTPSLYYCHETPRHLYDSEKGEAVSSSKFPWLDRIDPMLKIYRQSARKMDREAARTADLVLVNSKFSKQNVAERYQIGAEVNYNGVDTGIFRIVNGIPKQNFILSVGALQPLKGFDFLIETIGLIPAEKRPPVKIVSNSEAPGYRSFLEKLALESGVDLCIEVGLSLEALVCSYNEAAVFVYTPHDEPFGLAPLEAMACGLAVIGVAEGGVLESVDDNVTGRLLPRNQQQFAETIQQWLETPEIPRYFGQNGRQYVLDNWSWDAAVCNFESYLEQAAVS